MTTTVVMIVQAVDGGAAIAMAMLVAALVARSAGGFGRDQRAALLAVTVFLSVGFAFSTSVAAARGFSSAVDGTLAIVLLALSLIVPLALGPVIAFASPELRRVISTPGIQPGVVAVHALRALEGALFVAMVPLGVLPAVFGLSAGFGDILVGLFALSAGRWISAGRYGRAMWWNAFGLLDFANATVMGLVTIPGPLYILHTNPTSALLLSSPLTIIPTFSVPIFALLHLVSLRFLVAARSAARATQAPHRETSAESAA